MADITTPPVIALPAELLYNARPTAVCLSIRSLKKNPMPLDQSRKKHMRTIGHHLNPIVTVSEKGLSEGIHLEVERALEDHELIKMKLALGDPAVRRQMATELCEQHRAELVQQIGKVILIYRKAQKPNPKLSNLLRPA